MKKLILLISFLLITIILQSQNLVNNGSNIYVNSGTSIIISGNYINQSSGATQHGEIESDGTIVVKKNWSNNATSGNVFINQNTTGSVYLSGNSLQTIGGTQETSFENLIINNTNIGVELQQNIQVLNFLNIQDGDIDLKDQNIDLENNGTLYGETETQRIKATNSANSEGLGLGYIIARNRDLNIPSNENIAGLGLSITSANNLGNTDIIRGHLRQTSSLFNTGESINRYYEISSSNPALSTFNFSYFDAELNGNIEDSLIYFIDNPTWYINTSIANTQALETTTSDFSKFTLAYPIIETMNGGIIIEDQTLCYNEIPESFTNLTSPTGGYGTWIYQWEYQENCSGSWIPIANSNSLTYNETSNLTTNRCYRRKSINDYDTAYSNNITITISDNLDGGIISEDQILCFNNNPEEFTNLTSPSGGNGLWIYQWEYQENCTGSWIPVANTNNLIFDDTTNLTTNRCYRRSATNNCGTIYSNTITTLINPELLPGTIKGGNNICAGGNPNEILNQTLASGGIDSIIYQWEYQENCIGTWTSIANSNNEFYDPPSGLTNTRCYRRATTNTCGTVYSNIETVTVYDIPNINIIADTSICEHDTLHLNEIGGEAQAWEWQGVNLFSSTSQDTSIINVTMQASGRYYLTITDIHGCINNDSVDINILPLPIMSLDDSLQICYGQTAILDAENAGATYVWNDGSTNMTYQTSTSGTYTVTITNNICSIIDSTVLSVTNAIILDLGNDTAICAGDTLILDAENNGSTYLWSDGSSDMINQVSTEGTYSVLVTTVEGCEGGDTINLLINQLPIVDLGNDISFCDGDSISLDAENDGATYIWNNGGSEMINNVTTGGTYIVTVTDENLCNNSDTINIIQNSLPNIDLGVDTGFCEGNTIILDAENIGSTFLWNDGSNEMTNYVSTSGTYIVTVTTENNCQASDTIQITIVAYPEPVITGNNIACINTEGIYSVTTENNHTYSWQISSGGIIIDNALNPITINWISQGTHTITITEGINNFGNCEISTTYDVILSNDIPTLLISNPGPVCYGESVDISNNEIIAGSTDIITINYLNTDSSILTNTIINNPGNYFVQATNGCGISTEIISIKINDEIQIFTDTISPSCETGDDGTIIVVAINGEGSYTYNWDDIGNSTDSIITGLAGGIYYLTVSDSLGCTASDTVNLISKSVDCLVVPSAFTPNGDGINDQWNFKNIHLYPNTKVEIFNRWGNLIYATNDYENNVWDGIYKGKDAATGSYVYIITLSNGTDPINGVLTIIR